MPLVFFVSDARQTPRGFARSHPLRGAQTSETPLRVPGRLMRPPWRTSQSSHLTIDHSARSSAFGDLEQGLRSLTEDLEAVAPLVVALANRYVEYEMDGATAWDRTGECVLSRFRMGTVL